MDAILRLPPGLPPHDAAPLRPVPSTVVAQWPAGTFVENIAVHDGSAIVSILSEARLDRVAADGSVAVLRLLDQPPTGLALMGGHLYVAVGEPGRGEPALWRLDPVTGEGGPFMPLAGLLFANGLTPFAPGRLLVADSWLGRLCLVDLAARTTRVWAEDELFTRARGIDLLPGANGVKRYGDEVSVSSTGRGLLLRVPVLAGGWAGEVEITGERLRADDLCYDGDGRLYLATHVGHTLDRLDRDGRRVTLGGPEQGLAGSTSCAFLPDGALLVTTTGGLIAPYEGTLQTAKLVRLDVGGRGHDLARPWEIVSVAREPTALSLFAPVETPA